MRCLNKVGNYCFDKIEELKQEREMLRAKRGKVVMDTDPSMTFYEFQFQEGLLAGQIETYADILTMVVEEVKTNLN